jgi:hypothetical protein
MPSAAMRLSRVQAEKQRQEELKRQKEEEEAREYRRSLRFKVSSCGALRGGI